MNRFLTRPAPHSVIVRGALKNFNTIEEFKNVNKQELFNATAKEMWTKTKETNDASHLFDFLLITFADLKKYKYYYWFPFPAFAAKPAWEIDGEWTGAEDALGADVVSSLCTASGQHLYAVTFLYVLLGEPVRSMNGRVSYCPPVHPRCVKWGRCAYIPDASQQRHTPRAVSILLYLSLFQSCSGGAHAVRLVAFLYCAYAFDPPPP